MNILQTSLTATLYSVFTLLTGCIQEDPQVDLLRKRLESTEAEISKLRAKADQTGKASKPSAPAPDNGKIEELQAKIAHLEQENSNLSAKLSQSVVPLTQEELLLKLATKSKPLREKIKTLYKVEQTSLRDVVIPNLSETPYSCTVHLKLNNLATGEREQVDIPATADAQGEWTLPQLEEIASNIQPDSPVVAATPLPRSPEQSSPDRQPAPPPDRTSAAQPSSQTVPVPAPDTTAQAPRQPQPQPTRRPVPAGPGQVVGEMKVNW